MWYRRGFMNPDLIYFSISSFMGWYDREANGSAVTLVLHAV